MNRAPNRAVAVPDALPLNEALRRCAPLADLRRRLQESSRQLEAVLPSLPAPLRSHVRAGPVDETGWTLLAANAAVAAKLKQLRPRLEQALAAAGCPVPVVRIKVLQPSGR